MLDLREDGTIGLDFGDGQVVTFRPPKVGGYRRLRKELFDVDSRRAVYEATLPEDMPDLERRNLSTEFHEQGLLDWWKLILMGDDTFKSLVTADSPPAPPDVDDWPMILATNGAATQTIGHWAAAPLRSGG